MFSGVKEKLGRELREKITPTRGIILGALALFYLLLVILSAVPGISHSLTRLMGTEFRLPGRVICSMFRRILVVYTAGIGLYIAFVVGRRLSSGLDRLQAWLTRRCSGLAKVRQERSVRGWLVRHFLIPHNTDLFAVCWIGVYVLQFFLCLAGLGPVAWLLLLVPCFVLGLRIGQGTPKRPGLVSRIFFGFLTLAMAVCTVLLLSRFEALRSLVLAGEQPQGMLQAWLMSLVGLTVQSLVLALYATQERKEYRARSLTQTVAVLTLLYLIMEVVLKGLIDNYTLSAALLYARGQVFSPLVGFNVFFAVLIVLSLEAICGPRLGGVLSFILYMVLLVGNAIKILYQGSLFTPIDLLVIKELFEIAPQYIGTAGVVLLVVLVVLLVGLIVWQIKRVARFLCPHPSIFLMLIVPVLVFFSSQLYQSTYSSIVYGQASWLPSYTYWRVNGTTVYNLYNAVDFFKIFPSKPEGYSEETMEELEQEFDQYATETETEIESDVQPDVVLVMAESLFDISQMEGVSFNQDLTETVRTYQVGNIVSPRYGGGTAGAEFEGITGYSNAFFVNELIAYTAYFNDSEKRVPSIASVFHDAGYESTVIHLNDPQFYNRKQAFQELGFDQFLSIADFAFTEEQKNGDGYVQDQYFFDVIQEQLESSEEPQFIFGISIEGHNPYESKYEETSVKVTSDGLNESEIHELEQYGQSVLNFDQDLKEFIEYLQQREKPTIVYVWGDHLPILQAYEDTGYLDSDMYARYTTPFVAYSNYSDVSVDVEYMTPNQITPQILRTAGVPHDSYYDYIYSLREDYPVVHHDYTTDLESERMQKYWAIQYDLMFGEQYLLGDH